MTRLPLFLLVLATLLLGSTQLGAEQMTFARGDVDGDGRFSSRDLVLMVDWIAGIKRVDVITALDLDRNGRISSADVLQMFIVSRSTAPPRMETLRFDRGDLNGDLQFDMSDLMILGRYLTGSGSIPVALDAADLDRSGWIDRQDQVLLERLVRSGSGPRTP